jgi:hypothetical protein
MRQRGAIERRVTQRHGVAKAKGAIDQREHRIVDAYSSKQLQDASSICTNRRKSRGPGLANSSTTTDEN